MAKAPRRRREKDDVQMLAEIRAVADRIGLTSAVAIARPNPTHRLIQAHFEAYTAVLELGIATAHDAPPFPDREAEWIARIAAATAARRKLFACRPPRTIADLAALVSYTLTFSMEPRSDSDDNEEPIRLLKIVDAALRQASKRGEHDS